MTTFEKVLFIYIGIVSLIAVVVTIYDKRAAEKEWRRVPEKVLLILAAAGASLAMYITMRRIRHKTRKAKFMAGIPAIFVAQILLTIGIYQLVT